MTTIRACFPKLGHFFQNLEKGQGKTLLPTPLQLHTWNNINKKVFNFIIPTPKLKPTKTTVCPYQVIASLLLQGKFIATIQSQYQQILTTFHFTKGNGISILVRTTSENFARRSTKFSTRHQDHQSRQSTSRW